MDTKKGPHSVCCESNRTMRSTETAVDFAGDRAHFGEVVSDVVWS